MQFPGQGHCIRAGLGFPHDVKVRGALKNVLDPIPQNFVIVYKKNAEWHSTPSCGVSPTLLSPVVPLASHDGAYNRSSATTALEVQPKTCLFSAIIHPQQSQAARKAPLALIVESNPIVPHP